MLPHRLRPPASREAIASPAIPTHFELKLGFTWTFTGIQDTTTVKLKSKLIFIKIFIIPNTVEHGQLITKTYLGEHKVITAEQQFLGLILWFFMYLKWPWLLRLFAVLL